MKKSKLILILIILFGGLILLTIPAYFAGQWAFNHYFKSWGDKLVSLEKQGLLSEEFGAAWQDIITQDAMTHRAEKLTAPSPESKGQKVRIVNGVRVGDYPSLSIIARLNEINAYSNTIEITDRKDRAIAIIRTDHARAKVNELPKTLLTALIAAEDENFWKKNYGFEYKSYVRAAVNAVIKTLTTFKKAAPQGTSTITQQVAKLFISSLDEQGRRYVGRTVNRKLAEMRLAAALRKTYQPGEILEVYANHCVTSDYGLVGYRDIAQGLFGKRLQDLSDAECVYLARMVKWGRNIKPKIARQCRIDMPRMGAALGWNAEKQKQVMTQIDSLAFNAPRRVQTQNGQLVDVANTSWQEILRRNGASPAEIADMDLIDPNSLIRKKGNLKIRLTIDLPLQQQLESLVKSRGYGPDTILQTDVRIGSSGLDVARAAPPPDTMRRMEIVSESQSFAEPGSNFLTTLVPCDTLVTNIRYTRIGPKLFHRSCFYYTRRMTRVDGQYFAYCIMDSRTGALLAYYSKDKIGSHLAGLLRNRTPNGSSTAKPIFNALNFDMGNFRPYDKWTDANPIGDSVSWARDIVYEGGRPAGVSFKKSAVRGQPYVMSNHLNIFEGCQYVFNQLAMSNNILGVENVYRLDKTLFDRSGAVNPEAFQLAQFFNRISAFGRIKNELKLRDITGVRVYKELCRIAGVDIDSMTAYGKRIAISDSLYSVALGTLELSIYEQMHLFNVLYNNELIEQPASHPSLMIDSIILNNNPITISDTIRKYHPFGDINNIRPTLLGLYKRLTSNAADGLRQFDIPFSADSSLINSNDSSFSSEAYSITHPLSNFAKSGTSDDVIRPFNVDVTSKKRTNYGIWNAVLRVDLSLLSKDTARDTADIALACIGECNTRFTGVRDGKTLHKFVSAGLLKKAGLKCSNGFFTQYENYLKKVTPEEMKNCGAPLDSAAVQNELREAGD